MIVSEYLSNYFQEQLGNKYLFMPDSLYNDNYTEAREYHTETDVGYLLSNTAEYNKLRKDKIIGIVSATNTNRISSPAYYKTADFTIQFSVPTNIVKRNLDGDIIETPKFNFYTEIETMSEIIVGNKNRVVFSDDNIGKLIMSEPSLIGKENDGEFVYKLFSTSGSVIITNNATFGSEYKIEIWYGSQYYELDGVNNFTCQNLSQGNAINKVGLNKTEQNVAQGGWNCTFSIDDIKSTNIARERIYAIIHAKPSVITSSATGGNKQKLKIKITYPFNETIISREFWSIPTVNFDTTMNGVGVYTVTLVDDNKGV